MARRKKSGGAKTRTTRTVEIHIPTATNGTEDSTSGSASTEEIIDDLSVLHHKKFGNIRVKNEEEQELTNGDASNRHAIYNVQNDIPLDGSVIIKPGIFSAETITNNLDNIMFYQEIDDKAEAFMSVLKGFEKMTTTNMIPLPKSEEITSPKEVAQEAVEPKIESDDMDLETKIDEETVIPKADVADIPQELSVLPKVEEECASTDTTGSESSSVSSTIRRSTRIRSIGILKQKERSVAGGSPDLEKPVKVKSRWRRSSELEMHVVDPRLLPPAPADSQETSESEDDLIKRLERERLDAEEGLKTFIRLVENEHHTPRNSCREAKRMTCDCVLSKEEVAKGDIGCLDDCLNRMLFLECGQRCALGDNCANKRFQRRSYVDCMVFKTEKKGYGLRAEKAVPKDTFIMEYVGEVVDQTEFARRVKTYAKNDVKHFYFMALKGDTVIDATSKGNISRFINHSCDPNAETQKWTVNGELRIGFFSRRHIQPGEEITFDYRFQRYGKEAQKCYCEAVSCRGWIGENADDDDEDDEEEEDEDEEEDEEEEDEQIEAKTKNIPSIPLPPDSNLEISTDTQTKIEDHVKRVKKSTEKKQRSRERPRRKLEKPVVEDLGLEEELQRLSITGLKNRAHTLMLSRLMVRAEDWSTRCRLVAIIREGDEPCRRLFLDYRGLRFLHSWMQSISTDTADCCEKRLEILKTLQSLPIPHKTMLMESKVLALVEDWSQSGLAASILSPDGDSAGSDENKPPTNRIESDDQVLDRKTSPTGSDSPSSEMKVEKIVANSFETPSAEEKPPPEKEEIDFSAVRELALSLLKAWAPLKEIFKIPKKERMEQMKEHEREADRGYRQSSFARYHLDKIHGRYKLERDRDRPRDRDRDRERDRDRKRSSKESPPYPDPEWLCNGRRVSKQERRRMFALKVLQEEEAARHRMQQEELWLQHKARCEALGVDPSVNPTMDPISGCPIFFDQTTRTWSPNPPPPAPFPPFSGFPPPFQGFPGDVHPMYPMGMPNGVPTPNLPYPMMTYVNRPPFPTPSPSLHLTPNYTATPQFATPQNIIPLTPDPSIVDTDHHPHKETPELMHDSPILTEIPLDTPMKLPPKWRTATDSRGYVYYYHTKDRISQWEPPSWTEEEASAEATRTLAAEEESSSESSETDSDEEEEGEGGEGEEEGEEEELETGGHETAATTDRMDLEESSGDIADSTQTEEDSAVEVDKRYFPPNQLEAEAEAAAPTSSPVEQPSQSDFVGETNLCDVEDVDLPPVPTNPKPTSKRREGLVQEHLISPRHNSSNRTDSRKYKEVKKMLRRRKEERRIEKAKQKIKKRRREKRVTSAAADTSTDKKIKELFKSQVAGAIVGQLNAYRKTDCKVGRIMNNEDFKHLARKLTHIVMLKEMKQRKSVDDLECNDSVKAKSKDFVKKYMAKFGEEYMRSPQ